MRHGAQWWAVKVTKKVTFMYKMFIKCRISFKNHQRDVSQHIFKEGGLQEFVVNTFVEPDQYYWPIIDVICPYVHRFPLFNRTH